MPTVLSRLDDHAKIRPDAPAYGRKAGDAWVTTSWRKYRDEVFAVGRALIALGLEPGGTVGILSFNRPEWALATLGAMAAGGAAVGIYTAGTAPQVAYVVRHARCRVVVVENAEQWRKLAEVRAELVDLAWVVVLDAADVAADDGVLGWRSFLALAEGVPPAALRARVEALRGDQLGSSIYTSGTTGQPKGVMLTHDNLVETGAIVADLFGLRAGDVGLSYLPLAHIAEQSFSIHLAVSVGITIYYAEAPETIPANLAEVRPTIVFGVPRVWEKLCAGVKARLQQAPAGKRRLAERAMAAARAAAAQRNQGKSPGPGLRAREWIADRLVLAKVRAALGFDRVRLASSGAAPIPQGILEFFAGLGLTIYEVWGLSETTGPATWNRPGRTRFGTVGPALPEVEVVIAADGELLVRGPNVFAGYLDDPEATAAVLIDGWLQTGDLGRIDDDGCVVVTGRKKEILITSGGKNVAPAAIESALKQLDLVADAVVLGDGRRYLTALLSLEPEAASRFARERGIAGDLHLDPDVRAALEEGVAAVNKGFSRVEHVRDFRVLPRQLTIEDGELTPTLKVKRRVVEERWEGLIEEMYVTMAE